MSNFSNITVQHYEDDKVSLLIDGKAISERYAVRLDATIIDELQNLADGGALTIFEQFIFSHQDLNFEHSYQYVTNILNHNNTYKLVTQLVYKIKAADQAPVEHNITKNGQSMTEDDVRAFINQQISMSLEKYTDLKYAY
jgi:hypothetical protein